VDIAFVEGLHGEAAVAAEAHEMTVARKEAETNIQEARKSTTEGNEILSTSGQALFSTPSSQLLARLLDLLVEAKAETGDVMRRELAGIFRAQQAFNVIRSLRHMLWKVHKWRVGAFGVSSSKDGGESSPQGLAEELDKSYSTKIKKLGTKVNTLFQGQNSGAEDDIIAEVLKTSLDAKGVVDKLMAGCQGGSSEPCQEFSIVPAEETLLDVRSFEANVVKTLFRSLSQGAHELQKLLSEVGTMLDLSIAEADVKTLEEKRREEALRVDAAASELGSEETRARKEGSKNAEKRQKFADIKARVEAFQEALEVMVRTSREGERGGDEAPREILSRVKTEVDKMGTLAEFELLSKDLEGWELYPKERRVWDAGPAELVKLIFTMRDVHLVQPLGTLMKALGLEVRSPVEGGGTADL